MSVLNVEMLPSSAWGANLRNRLTQGQWNRCKRYAKDQSGGVCAVCSGVGPDYPVDCHERWEFLDDHEPPILRLTGLLALCPACHRVVHFGRTRRFGGEAEARAHLATVNGWSTAEVDVHIADADRRWMARNARPWTVDLTWVTTALGLDLARPANPDHHRAGVDGVFEGEDNPFPAGSEEHWEHDFYMEMLAARDD